jgi:hypothetical protein
MKRWFALPTLLVSSLLFAQPAGKQPMTLDDVTDCTYFDRQIEKMEQCITKYKGYAGDQNVLLHEGHCAVPGCKKSEVNTEQRANQATPYAKAAALCADAKQKYYVEKAKCEQRTGAHQPGGPSSTSPATAQEALRELQQLSNAFANLGKGMTDQQLTALNRIKDQISKLDYKGAGLQGDDPLANLGLAFSDQSQVTNGYGPWGDENYFGQMWDFYPPVLTDVDSKDKYCAAWRKADVINCDRRCDAYYARIAYQRAQALRRNERCVPEAADCRGWCPKMIEYNYDSCMAQTTEPPSWYPYPFPTTKRICSK